ncbi:MAG: YggS family pyridoxal phosphate-dependent enzyme [Lachnospiraceae bacterium]|nr:YggS family pyridoxal phosphate-dependent enzyme [Lachnospiraceae bacterium]
MEDINIQENLKAVEERIQEACKKSGRKREDVTLVAVSKTKPVSLIMKAYEAGIRDFGENKAQELAAKYEEMPKDIRWHMIGHLQRNKVKYIIDKAAYIHSVDSLALAEEISRQAVKHGVTAHVFVEINIGDEETKFGVPYDEVTELVDKIIGLPNLSVEGLMCIAPNVDNSEENRKFFIKMREKSVDINLKLSHNVTVSVLSMGMTGDYQVAIEEGATMIRVGTGIFGERTYKV